MPNLVAKFEELGFTFTKANRGGGLKELLRYKESTFTDKANRTPDSLIFPHYSLKDMGLNSIAGLSNASNGMPKEIRPIVDSVLLSMAIECGLSSAILNPCDKNLMNTVKTAEVILNRNLYADSYLEL